MTARSPSVPPMVEPVSTQPELLLSAAESPVRLEARENAVALRRVGIGTRSKVATIESNGWCLLSSPFDGWVHPVIDSWIWLIHPPEQTQRMGSLPPPRPGSPPAARVLSTPPPLATPEEPRALLRCSSAPPEEPYFSRRPRERQSARTSTALCPAGTDPRERARLRLQQSPQHLSILAVLDLAVASRRPEAPLDVRAAPTLKASMPVQKTTSYTHRRSREGRDDRLPPVNDFLWIFGVSPASAASMLDSDDSWSDSTEPPWQGWSAACTDDGPRTTPLPLLAAWIALMVGVSAEAAAVQQYRSRAEDEDVEPSLAECWVEQCFVLFVAVGSVSLLLHAAARGGQYSSSSSWKPRFCRRRTLTAHGWLLLLMISVTYGLGSATWAAARRLTPGNAAVFFHSSHPMAVLMVRASAGAPVRPGETFGASTILLGAACAGLSDIFGPEDHVGSVEQVIGGMALALCSSFCIAIWLMLSKWLRLDHRGFDPPLLALLGVSGVGGVVALIVASWLHKGVGMKSDTARSYLFGWGHETGKWMPLGLLHTVGMMGIIWALKVLPVLAVCGGYAAIPVLIFVGGLAGETTARSTPLPTKSVGALLILVGCVTVCRSSVFHITQARRRRGTAPRPQLP
eukprot:Hpha_TRINITY_DN15410_c3_g4::TRINITY_DN15410_c3_g4_i1::g.173499::m.173499